MIHRLKREKRLTNKALRCVLGSTIEHLDLEGCYLTESSIKLVRQKCPHLKVLSLYGCGYIMTDHFMEILLKVSNIHMPGDGGGVKRKLYG